MAQENSKRPRQAKSTPPEVGTPPWALVLIALQLDRAGFQRDPGPLLRRAQQLIARVPEHLTNTDPGQRSFEDQFNGYFKEVDAEKDRAKKWGFSSPILPASDHQTSEDQHKVFELWRNENAQAIPFEAAVKESWCDHKTVVGLEQFLRTHDYPEHYFKHRLVTEAGYRYALTRNQDQTRQKDRQRKAEARARQRQAKRDSG